MRSSAFEAELRAHTLRGSPQGTWPATCLLLHSCDARRKCAQDFCTQLENRDSGRLPWRMIPARRPSHSTQLQPFRGRCRPGRTADTDEWTTPTLGEVAGWRFRSEVASRFRLAMLSSISPLTVSVADDEEPQSSIAAAAVLSDLRRA